MDGFESALFNDYTVNNSVFYNNTHTGAETDSIYLYKRRKLDSK